VASMTLMQGAMSLWSFCSDIPMDPGRAGYFRRVVEDNLVFGPILASTSYHDRAVRTFYAIAATMAKQVEFPAGSLELPKYGGIGASRESGPALAPKPSRTAAPTYGSKRVTSSTSTQRP
jgi:hypothetical protein